MHSEGKGMKPTQFTISEAAAELQRVDHQFMSQGGVIMTTTGVLLEADDAGVLQYRAPRLKGKWRTGPLADEDDLRAVLSRLSGTRLAKARVVVAKAFGLDDDIEALR